MSQKSLTSRILRTLLPALLLAAPAWAAAPRKTTVSGTLTIDGKPTVMKFGWASLGHDQAEDRDVLVLLFADRDLPAADRAPARLAELAAAGKLSALRILWSTGFDWVRAAPYQAGLAGSGRLAEENPTLNLDAFDELNVKADAVSKRLGQKVHYSVEIEGPIEKIATVEVEPAAVVEEAPAGAGASGGSDPRSLKMRLGKLGYEFGNEGFFQAVVEGNLEAVQLFLELGQSPNIAEHDNQRLMIIAADRCQAEPTEVRTPILKALLAAGGDPDTKDDNGSTPLIWAAQFCDAEAIEALIAAKANVNAKAKGGATPLMMAQVFNRAEIVALLKKAGAKEN